MHWVHDLRKVKRLAGDFKAGELRLDEQLTTKLRLTDCDDTRLATALNPNDQPRGRAAPQARTMKPPAERTKSMRQRKEAAGLKRYEHWLHPEDWPEVRKVIDRAKKRRERKEKQNA